MSGFQTTVNNQPAPAVAGDFASANPRASMLAGDSALVVDSVGVTVGRFAWANAAGVVSSFWKAASRIGFVHREMQASITTWLAQASMVIQAGMPVTLMKQGDFWGLFAGGATIGQKVYAYYATGALYAAATGTPPTNAITVTTFDTTTTVTVTANGGGGTIAVGQPIAAAGIPAGAYITALGTGTGGTGTYVISAAATASATVAGTVTTAVETEFTVASTAAAGELAKLSTWE